MSWTEFCPNLTYGMPIVEAVCKLTKMPIDVHLMIREPAKYAPAFIDCGADLLTFHIEAQPDPIELLEMIRSLRGWGRVWQLILRLRWRLAPIRQRM